MKAIRGPLQSSTGKGWQWLLCCQLILMCTAPLAFAAATNPCDILDDPQKRPLLSGPFEMKLLRQCGRSSELGTAGSPSRPPVEVQKPSAGADNILVNDPGADNVATSHTQSETSIAVNQDTGTICTAFNDSGSNFIALDGYSGFSRSTDGGRSFTDGGPITAGVGGQSYGDPSLVWRKADGKFYYASLCDDGLCLWKSNDDCGTFSQVSVIHSGTGDDKEIMTVDNNPSSPYAGRLYVAWTDFNAAGGLIFVTSSDDGTIWSSPVAVSSPDDAGLVQGAWPATGPSGELYVGWVNWFAYPDGPINIRVVRSFDGGSNFDPVSNPLIGGINPRDPAASTTCTRPALNGNIRYLPSPQLTVGKDGTLHVVYSATPPPAGGTGLVTENFNGAWPPAGWSISDWDPTFDCVWQRNDSLTRDNFTGGDGFSAMADSDDCGTGTSMDSGLFTPAFSLAGAANAVLEFKYDYNYWNGTDGFEVWLYNATTSVYIATLLQWTGSDRRGPGAVRLDLTPYVGFNNLKIMFRYYGDYAWWAQVDDVRVVKNVSNWPSADTIDVYYRRSTNQGATWDPEVQINDDTTDTDQFFPTVSADKTGKTIVATWYDRRLDPNNYLFDYYGRVSRDGGLTWQGSVRLTTSSSPVYIDPLLATCYHGDYDQQTQYQGKAYVLWSDDRNQQDGHNDPDVWFNYIKTGFPWPMFLPAITNSR